MGTLEGLRASLEKLRRNEAKMSEAQKKKYAAPLARLRQEIQSQALTVGRDFMFAETQTEEDDAYARERIRSVLSENEIADAERAALAVLFSSYNLDEYFISLLSTHLKIYYLGYGPYWTAHCKPVKDKDDAAEFSYYNDLIDMYWVPEWHEWKRKGEWAVTLRLPPTMELISEEYRREVENVLRRKTGEAGPG